MKKIVVFTAVAVIGFANVSCSSDDNEFVADSQKNNAFNQSIDTTSVSSSNLTFREEDGPGDTALVLTLPPKK